MLAKASRRNQGTGPNVNGSCSRQKTLKLTIDFYGRSLHNRARRSKSRLEQGLLFCLRALEQKNVDVSYGVKLLLQTTARFVSSSIRYGPTY